MPCDNLTALGLSVADLAALPGMSDDDIKCIEGGTEPTAPCRGGLAEALVPDAL